MVKDAEDITEPSETRLKVKMSPIRFKGSVRVHHSVLEEIGCSVKDQVVIISDKKKILRTLFADDHVEEDSIKLRAHAMSSRYRGIDSDPKFF